MNTVVVRVDAEGQVSEVLRSSGAVQVLVLDERVPGHSHIAVASKIINPCVLLEHQGRVAPEQVESIAREVALELAMRGNQLGLSHQGRVQAQLTSQSILKQLGLQQIGGRPG